MRFLVDIGCEVSEIRNIRRETALDQPYDAVDLAVDDLIQRVGERVRRVREQKGLSRRALSEISGVSLRYLAQLEAGEGNISIGLLQKIALALGHPIEQLVGGKTPWTSEGQRVADLYRSAPIAIQRAVWETLNPDPPETLRAHRICLIGLRGAGKSTLGAMAGEALGVPFVELNRHIEEHSGMPVNEIYALYGEEGYRRLEVLAVDRVIDAYDRVILAVAGGLVAEPDTYKTLLSHFHTVWLKASPNEHMERVQAQGDTRPMAGNPEAMEQLKSILRSREVLYERAQAELDTAGKPLRRSCDELVALIDERGFLEDASGMSTTFDSHCYCQD